MILPSSGPLYTLTGWGWPGFWLSISGSFSRIAMLCSTANAMATLLAFNGFSLISPWRIPNRLFQRPNAISMDTRALECAVLYRCLDGVSTTLCGVIRYRVKAYPLSPKIIPSSRRRWFVSRYVLSADDLNIKLSCDDPGHLALTCVNLLTRGKRQVFFKLYSV